MKSNIWKEYIIEFAVYLVERKLLEAMIGILSKWDSACRGFQLVIFNSGRKMALIVYFSKMITGPVEIYQVKRSQHNLLANIQNKGLEAPINFSHFNLCSRKKGKTGFH